jgi:hypothetical protein
MSTRATMVAIQGVFKVDDIEDTIFQNSHVQQHVEKSPDLGAIYSSRIEVQAKSPEFNVAKFVWCLAYRSSQRGLLRTCVYA